MANKYVYDTSVTPDYGIDYSQVVGDVEKRANLPKDEPLYRGAGVGRMRNAKDIRDGGIYRAVKRGKII